MRQEFRLEDPSGARCSEANMSPTLTIFCEVATMDSGKALRLTWLGTTKVAGQMGGIHV